MIDPLADLDLIDIQSFDIARLVSIYPDKSGFRWWTKAWFNNRKEGERAVEISRAIAIQFLRDEVEKDEWMEKYFPKQMEIYHNALSQTRQQIMDQLRQQTL